VSCRDGRRVFVLTWTLWWWTVVDGGGCLVRRVSE
jgi:hypothetical protein